MWKIATLIGTPLTAVMVYTFWYNLPWWCLNPQLDGNRILYVLGICG